MKLIMMGTGPFAVPSFEALRSSGHEIALVVTKPSPPVKSRKGPPPSPVRDWANTHQLPIYDPSTINLPEAVDRITALGADLMIVCDYGHILKNDALAATKLGGINLHGSLLPAYRGAAPVQRALLSGDAVTGVSVIHMTPKLDGGPIIATRETEILSTETAGELEERLSQIGVAATVEAVDLLSDWDGESQIGEIQDPDKVTKAPRLSKAEALIDWTKSYAEIDCHVRGMQPWPTAYTFLSLPGKKQPIRLAIRQIQKTEHSAGSVPPGEIVPGDRFLVSVADCVIEISVLQPAGKREMASKDFLRGHTLTAEARFGE